MNLAYEQLEWAIEELTRHMTENAIRYQCLTQQDAELLCAIVDTVRTARLKSTVWIPPLLESEFQSLLHDLRS